MTLAAEAQNTEILTNSSIIKMSKAKLSDEIIIDMIHTSTVSFDLSAVGLKDLDDANVPSKVVEAMKSAAGIRSTPAQSQTTTFIASQPANQNSETGDIFMKTEKQPEPQPQPQKPEQAQQQPQKIQQPEKISEPVPEKQVIKEPEKAEAPAATDSASPSEGETISFEALNYTAPLIDLVKFNEDEYKSLEMAINEWNDQVKDYLRDIDRSKEDLLRVENDLRIKKNADTKSFGDGIISLKAKLKTSREKYGESKENMLKGGESLAKKLETIMNTRLKSLDKAYSEAARKIESGSNDPAEGETSITYSYTIKKAFPETEEQIVYTTEMLAWYQNEIMDLNAVIKNWNPKIDKTIQDDGKLKKQLEPLESKLNELKQNSKQNKTEISALKKEISKIEKERKKLSDQMKDDSRDLSSAINQTSEKSQNSIKERFTDIIDNVTYSFREKISL